MPIFNVVGLLLQLSRCNTGEDRLVRFSSAILRGSTEGVAGKLLTPGPPGVSNQRNLVRGFHTQQLEST